MLKKDNSNSTDFNIYIVVSHMLWLISDIKIWNHPTPTKSDLRISFWKNKVEALPRFELGISCLLDRRFNQLSHRASLG